MSVSIYDYIEKIVPQENILFDEPMSRHTTFRVGGAAKCLIKVNNKEQMKKLIPYLHMTGQNFFILGNGSNLLVGDKGYSGILVKLGEGMESVTVEGERMKISAGTLLSKAASAARENELTGMEFASGIPGTVGGAIVMNAGAYGGEMKQIVESVEVMNMEGEILVLDNDTMEFGYRKSVIKSRPFIVLETVLCLQKGKQEEISSKMEELSRLRREKQPLEYASAGSTFKRPEGYFAGKLIMDAGLRGFSIGGAKVSEKHCGFIVNSGNATAADIREVIDEVQKCVKAKFGVTLEREVIYLGDF
ncbi:MAG: UDP-N-acetylmuramate dehydrogenase [Lachnospiraceae bacterium]|nr:UDP-N-acetylmuramate dehydrogenase [Lachnospiraceae bacterium]GFH88902.1 UDP-N-acetylenolpyruvoylglucosamine reductase [Lachnospiraceae bacterium]